MPTTTAVPELLQDLFAIEGSKQLFKPGQPMQTAEFEPLGVWLIKAGVVRSLMPLPPRSDWRTIERHTVGTLVGWVGVVCNESFEHLRAAEAVEAQFISRRRFNELWTEHPGLRQWCAAQRPAVEAMQILQHLSKNDPNRARQLDDWKQTISNAKWLVDADPSDEPTDWFNINGSRWPDPGNTSALQHRLVHLPPPQAPEPSPVIAVELEQLFKTSHRRSREQSKSHLELTAASGPRDIPLAICESIGSFFNVPCNRDAVIHQVDAILRRQKELNLVNMGQLLSGLSLSVVLTEIPAQQVTRIPTPAIIQHQGCFALLDGVEPDGRLRILEPELGPLHVALDELLLTNSGDLEVLLIQRRTDSKEAKFTWGWFIPYLSPHRRELTEVLVASAITNTLALATPLGMQRLINATFSGSGSINGLLSIGLLLVLASLVKAVIGGLRTLLFTSVANQIDMATKGAILDQMVRLPQGFFDSRPVGQITFYFQQLDRLREFLIGQSLTTVVDFGFSLLYVAVLFMLNPLLTLVTLSTLPLFLILALVSNPLIEELIRRSVTAGMRTYSYLTEAITGIQTIKSQNAELKTRWEFQNRYSHLIGEDFKLRVSAETIGKLAEFINDLNGLLVITVGIYLVYQSELSLGSFIAFRIISGYITGPLVKVVQTWQQFKQASRNLRLVGDIVDRPTEQTLEQSTNLPMPPLVGSVAFESIQFRYTPEGDRILHDVTLDIEAGSFVGMVGGSGSGKSTLLKLLPRFYEPEVGRVLIDGIDVSKIELYSLRRQIGVVPQDSLLFDGTIKDNLLLVKPDASAEELIRAAKIACAHEFIMKLPQGYNSSVGERGAGLSGGQRQRMALARAVLQNPRMLILDEATSALDARTERQVCLNLFDAFRGRTVFFITHRLSTVRPADKIVLMDQGAVMEIGNHQELIALRGWYYSLFTSQSQEN